MRNPIDNPVNQDERDLRSDAAAAIREALNSRISEYRPIDDPIERNRIFKDYMDKKISWDEMKRRIKFLSK